MLKGKVGGNKESFLISRWGKNHRVETPLVV